MEPLHGIRIIDVTTNASGPMATGMLADQGADVIRFETIGSGDPSRQVGGTRAGVSAYNAYMNRNKRSMAVDIKNVELRPALYKLIETAVYVADDDGAPRHSFPLLKRALLRAR